MSNTIVADGRDSANEEWRAIPGVENYEVSNTGRVRSLDRTTTNGARRKGKLVSQHERAGSHLRVTLTTANGKRNYYVHRLVLSAFVGECPSGMQGCHNDGNPKNNRLENLRWDTASANRRDIIKHGNDVAVNRERCPLGHLLLPFNVPAAKLKRGHRCCRSCARARLRVREASMPLAHLADQIYIRELEKRAVSA